MKILVAYYSDTGNTQKVAKAIHDAVSDKVNVELSKIQKVTIDSLTNYDLFFLGTACHDADLARPFKRFLENLPQNTGFKLAGFFTHATYTPDSTSWRKELFRKWAGKCGPTFERVCSEKGIQFLGYFHCMGSPSKPIEDFIHREIITSEEEWNQYLPDLKTRPNANDLEDAKKFALNIISKL